MLFTYTVTKGKEADLGFNVFLTNPSSSLLGRSFEDIGRLTSSDSRRSVSRMKVGIMTSVTKSDYTYKAELERVVDGDTIYVKLDLGFGIKHREILRLAKINAAESGTAAGAKATAALKKILKDAPFLIVKTKKTDIYGRYIADIFFGEKSQTNPQKVADSGIYLNQLLLDRGLVDLY